MKNKEQVIDLDIVTLEKDIIITDPSYRIGTWCTHVVSNMRPGKYRAFAVVSDEGEWGMRVKKQYLLIEGMTIEDFEKKMFLI